MLRQQLSNSQSESTKKTTIKLPKQPKVEEIKILKKTINSNDNLSEICNFNDDFISCSPPDGYFMHNLRLRMEKV